MNKLNDPRALMINALHLLVNENLWQKTAEERALMTLASQDADYIPRVKEAGEIIKKNGETVQVMHNGLVVKKGGYQGEWQAKIIKGLKGVHEPQEEKVFFEVLKRLSKGSVMIELGSWWAYYSLWFLTEKAGSRAVCCEPELENLNLAKTNANLNNIESTRVQYYNSAAGKDDGKVINFKLETGKTQKVPIRSVDSIVTEQKLNSVDILHMDIQGAELSALEGAQKSIKEDKIRFIFISTHHYSISGDPLLHQKCKDFIKNNGGHIVAEHGILESASGDGLLVASFSSKDKDFKVEVSHISPGESLFREYEQDVDFLWRTHDVLLKYFLKREKEFESTRKELQTEKQKNLDLQNRLHQLIPLKRHLKTSVKNRIKRGS